MSMQPPGSWQYPPAAPLPPPQKSSVPTIAIVLGVVFFGGTCLLGVAAAVAIPAFKRFQMRAKSAEATSNLAMMFSGVRTRYEMGRDRGIPGLGRFPALLLPPTAMRTPMEVPRGTRVTDPPGTWRGPTWESISFALLDPHYFSYEYVNFGNGSFAVRAYGDLDGDGVLSTYERRGRVNAQGEVESEPMQITNELE